MRIKYRVFPPIAVHDPPCDSHGAFESEALFLPGRSTTRGSRIPTRLFRRHSRKALSFSRRIEELYSPATVACCLERGGGVRCLMTAIFFFFSREHSSAISCTPAAVRRDAAAILLEA